jgi:UDP-N-acetylglucosamine acyltransferase
MAYTHGPMTARSAAEGFGHNATLAGHITIGDYATVGGLVAIHQFVKIGDHAFIGGLSGVPKDIPPYVIAAGARVALHGLNIIGLKRHGMSDRTISLLKKAYRIIFRIGLTVITAIERFRAEVDRFRKWLNSLNSSRIPSGVSPAEITANAGFG